MQMSYNASVGAVSRVAACSCRQAPPLLQAQVAEQRRRRVVAGTANHRAARVGACAARIEALHRRQEGRGCAFTGLLQGWLGGSWALQLARWLQGAAGTLGPLLPLAALACTGVRYGKRSAKPRELSMWWMWPRVMPK